MHCPGAQVIQYKQLVGNERDASVQQDINQAVDTLVQQLRLQVCTCYLFVERSGFTMTTASFNIQAECGSQSLLLPTVCRVLHTCCV